MRFSQDFIEKVQQANNIVDIITQHTELKRSGDGFMGLCPFHGEKTPSFSVSEARQVYHCFGCKKGGNLFSFIEEMHGMSFPEAVEYLARRASIPLPEKENQDPGASKRREERELLLRVNRLTAVFYHRQLRELPADHPAKIYMAKRGLTDEIIEKFRLGVALNSWELFNFLKSKRVPLELAEKLSLIRPSKEAQKSTHYDFFRRRILFPIFSTTDQVIAFGGRTFSDEQPKYLNSTESPVFSKGRTLFGLNETAKHIRAKGTAIVVEGYMDFMALYRFGLTNVVATLGTAFTLEHAHLIKRHSENVTFLFDGDNAGIEAAEKALPIALRAGLLPRACILPDSLDPDEFLLEKGADALREKTDNAPELFQLVVGRWMQGFRGSPSDKVLLVKRLAPVMNAIDDKQLRELYLQDLANRLDVKVPWLRGALNDYTNEERPAAKSMPVGLVRKVAPATNAPAAANSSATANTFARVTDPQAAVATQGGAKTPNGAKNLEVAKANGETEEPRELIRLKGAPRDETFLLSLALQRERHLQEVEKQGVSERLTHAGVRQVLSVALERYRQKPDEFARIAALLASQIDQPGILTCSFDVTRNLEESEEDKLMADYVAGVLKKYVENQAKLMTKQMRDLGDQLTPEMLEQFMNYQRDRLSLVKKDKKD